MKEVLLIKIGELTLKGLNRRLFEDLLLKALRRALRPFGRWDLHIAQSTITAIPEEISARSVGDTGGFDGGFAFSASDANPAAEAALPDIRRAADAVARVFGIAAFSVALAAEKSMDAILENAGQYLKDDLTAAHTFKVEAKRSDKTFARSSPEICATVGEQLLREFPHLTVDVHNPDLTVCVEVREKYAFLHATQQKGAGGLPVGSAGHAAVLLSGGIDSPVAAWLMARRGLTLTAVHFSSPPYTSPRAEEKVLRLTEKVAAYAGPICLHVVPFTRILEEIREKCPEGYATVLSRRMMMRAAEKLARRGGCGALITGESLGQVASQTLSALSCTDAVVTMPVFRPLIGTDKSETIALARRIDTFDISVAPYEDCCTLFTPRHPCINPKLDAICAAEAALPPIETQIAAALGSTKTQILGG
jgi:thiamine biosynthesis protein ThiI